MKSTPRRPPASPTVVILARPGTTPQRNSAGSVKMIPEATEEDAPPDPALSFALVGRRNVGKSTYVNALAREDRMIVTDEPDAVRMTREAVAALDALDAVLSTSTVDTGAVGAAVEDVTRACNACHTSYREGDETTGYRMRSVPR